MNVIYNSITEDLDNAIELAEFKGRTIKCIVLTKSELRELDKAAAANMEPLEINPDGVGARRVGTYKNVRIEEAQ